ncbi:hypothetical protein GAY31_11380 [Azospirillum brasilense]|nr:hypothetical protein [Azospirillum brasilense]
MTDSSFYSRTGPTVRSVIDVESKLAEIADLADIAKAAQTAAENATVTVNNGVLTVEQKRVDTLVEIETARVGALDSINTQTSTQIAAVEAASASAAASEANAATSETNAAASATTAVQAKNDALAIYGSIEAVQTAESNTAASASAAATAKTDAQSAATNASSSATLAVNAQVAAETAKTDAQSAASSVSASAAQITTNTNNITALQTGKLAVNGNGSAVTVVASGSNASRSLAVRFADVLNVKDFGAVGDGTTNDLSAFTAAIAALPSRGGAIYVPPGSYALGGKLSVSNKHFSLYGAGTGTTKLLFTGGTGGIEFTDTTNNHLTVKVFNVRDLSISTTVGGYTAIYGSWKILPWFFYKYAEITNVFVHTENQYGAINWANGIHLNHVRGADIRGVHLINQVNASPLVGSAILFTGQSLANSVEQWRALYWDKAIEHRPFDVKVVSYTGATGTFLETETLSTPSGSGYDLRQLTTAGASGSIILAETTGSFTVGQTLTGSISGVTATVSGVQDRKFTGEGLYVGKGEAVAVNYGVHIDTTNATAMKMPGIILHGLHANTNIAALYLHYALQADVTGCLFYVGGANGVGVDLEGCEDVKIRGNNIQALGGAANTTAVKMRAASGSYIPNAYGLIAVENNSILNFATGVDAGANGNINYVRNNSLSNVGTQYVGIGASEQLSPNDADPGMGRISVESPAGKWSISAYNTYSPAGGLAIADEKAGQVRLTVDSTGKFHVLNNLQVGGSITGGAIVGSSLAVGASTALDTLHVKEVSNDPLATQLLLQNDNAGAGAAALAFQVSHAAEISGFAPKAGIAFERGQPNGGGALKFYNRTATDTAGYGASDVRLTIGSDGNVTVANDLGVLGNISGNVVASGSTTARSLAARFGERLSVFDIGCTANGTADDAAALNAFFAAPPSVSGQLFIPGSAKLKIGSTVTIPSGWSLVGPGNHGKVGNTLTDSYYNLGGQVRIASTASIKLSPRSGVKGLLIIRGGLTLPATTYAEVVALKAAMTGTAIICADASSGVSDNDVMVKDCMILGFGTAISDTADRMTVADVKIDCTNGVLVSGLVDITRLRNIHVWPFLTVDVPTGLSAAEINAVLTRDGYGFRFDNVAAPGGSSDWAGAVDCFTYGHNPGWQLVNASGIGLVRCQADYRDPLGADVRGFDFSGACDAELIGCKAVAQQTAVVVDTTSGMVKIIGSSFAGVVDNIVVNNGKVVLTSNSFHSGSGAAIKLTAGTDFASVTANFFENVGSAVFIDPTITDGRVVVVGSCGSVPGGDNRVNGGLQLTSLDGIAVGGGPDITFKGPAFSGEISYAGIRSSLVSATAGNEAASLIFSTNRLGTATERLVLDHDGHLKPATSAVYHLGSDTERWAKVWGVDAAFSGAVSANTQTIQGAGQATSAYSTTGASGGAILLKDTGSAPNNGGALVFAASQGSFGAIKGLLQDGTANCRGDLVIATRRVSTDSTLTEALRVKYNGAVHHGDTATNVIINANSMHVLRSYTIATLPAASGANGSAIVRVTDGAGGKPIVISNGTNWLYADGTIAA